jgi:hypothetical protein
VVLKLGQLGKWSRYTGKVLKCGAETGAVRKVEQIYREILKCGLEKDGDQLDRS